MKPKVIYQPLSPFVLGQKFGQNKACISTDGKRTVISCDGNNPPPGYKSVYGPNGHTGIDLGARHGQEVHCAQRGTVYSIDTNPITGLDVRIESEEGGIKFRHIYEHLLGYQHRVGDRIETGQLVGWADNTGKSSGDHLHFGMYVLENGRWAAVDPMKYMEPVFAKNILAINNTLKYISELVAKLLDNSASWLRG